MNIIKLLDDKQKKVLLHLWLNKGDVLFRENDICNDIGIVIEGEISIVSYLADGSEVIYNVIRNDEIFGNNLIFSSQPFYKGDIIASKDTQLVLIKKDDLIEIMHTNKQFMIEFIRIQSNTGKALNNRIRLLSMKSAEDRLLYHLHENNNIITYSSISSLAKELFLERETVSRLISKLEKNKIIFRDSNTIRLYNKTR